MFSAIYSWWRSLARNGAHKLESLFPRDLVTANGEPVIHVHEDDWGMRNIFPLTVQKEVSEDLDAAAVFAEEHKAPSGIGWTAIHMIKEPSTSYVETGLRVEEVAKALGPLMPRVKHFYATVLGAIGRAERDPYGSYEEDAWCFGFGPHCYIKLDADGELVKSIWFDINTDKPDEIAALRRSMDAINQLAPSFIGDYFMDAEVSLSDTQLLDQYFAQRISQIHEAERWLREQRANRA